MDQTTPKQPQGKAKANFVRILPHDSRYQQMSPQDRARNAKLPLFRGTISSPENPDEIFEYAVWDYTKDGKTFLAGPVRPLSTRAGVEDHLAAAQLSQEDALAAERDANTLSPHTIIIRTNAAKILKSDPRYVGLEGPEAELNERRPLYWLKWQRDAGTPEVRGSLWDRAGRYGPYLEGRTQYPLARDASVVEVMQTESLLEESFAGSSAQPKGRQRKSTAELER